MLFDVSSCLILDFQYSAILSLLFCVLNLHWLKLPKLVNNHGRNCTKTSESHGECVSNYAYRNHFLKLFIIYFHEAESMMGILYTTYRANDTGETPPPIFFYRKFSLFFFSTFFWDLLLFQIYILILSIFLNLKNYSFSP